MRYFIALLLMIVSLCAHTGDRTVNFQFTDIQGNNLTLSDFRGKWVIVNFYATWCPLCWMEVPSLNEMNKRKDVAVIGVALDYAEPSSVSEAITRHNIQFSRNVLGGSRRSSDSAYRQVGPVDFFPTSYVFDPKGNIVMFIPGQFKETSFLEFISKYK